MDSKQANTTHRAAGAVDAFRLAWDSGIQPRLEEYFRRGLDSGSEPRELLSSLLRIELHARRGSNAVPPVDSYVERFPEHANLIRRVYSSESAFASSDPWTETQVDRLRLQDQETRSIGRYTLVRELGRGSFGIVYEGFDPELDCRVAIKQLKVERIIAVIPEPEETAGQLLDNLLREARIAAKLRRYPNIIPVLDVLTVPGDDGIAEVYFIQQFLEGGDLRQLLRNGPLAPTEAARMLLPIAKALGNAHALGIYHRDLKPGNILLDEERTPYLADFGMAVDEALQWTLRGEVAGTYAYMSPEQTRGEAHLLDGRSDIWSLGVILYEVLTGKRPFQAGERDALCEEIQQREPRPPRMINPRLPAELERITLKCLAKSVTDRYSNAFDLAGDIEQWLADPDTVINEEDSTRNSVTVGGPAIGSRGTRSSWKRLAIGAALFVFVGAMAVGVLQRPRPDISRGFVRDAKNPLLAAAPVPLIVPSATDQQLQVVEAAFDMERQSFSIQSASQCFYTWGDSPEGRYLIGMTLRKPSFEGASGLFFGFAPEQPDDPQTPAARDPKFWTCHVLLLVCYTRGIDDRLTYLERHRLRVQRVGEQFYVVRDDTVGPSLPVEFDNDGLLEVRVNNQHVELIRWNNTECRELVLEVPPNDAEAMTCSGAFGVVNFYGAVVFSDASLFLEPNREP